MSGVLSLGAATAQSRPAQPGRICGPGYVHANLSWGEKCLRAGQFCKVGNPEYHQYGFDCLADGHLAYYSGGTSSKPAQPKPTSQPQAGADPDHVTSGGRCGVERWTVKTLQDRPRLLPVKKTSIAWLVSRSAPPDLPATRLPFERQVFRVDAAVIGIRPEEDSDLHLVLSDGTRTMIAESPSSACDSRAAAARRTQMTHARTRVTLCRKATIIGVAFFDFDHGQIGVAPNAIELHPILSFTCLRP
jgi:hypothetical protein